MGFEGSHPPLVEALGRQQEVDAQAAPHTANGVENVGKTGLGLEQLTELVHHYDEVRQRSRASPVPGHSAWYSLIELKSPASRSNL